MNRKTAVLLLLFPAGAWADVIAAPGFLNPASAWGGAWIGTYTGIPLATEPTGSQTVTDAELVTTAEEYSDITLEIQLSGLDGGIVDLSLAPDDGSGPGNAIASATVNLQPTPVGTLTTYDVFFPGATLAAGTYWLIASSPTVEPFLSGFQTPIVGMAPYCSPAPDPSGDPVCGPALNDDVFESSSNGGPWQSVGATSFAYELDGTPDTQSNGLAGLAGTPVPEPRRAALCILLGLVGVLGVSKQKGRINT